jgi:O-antigen chain-terminating methyltransferase
MLLPNNTDIDVEALNKKLKSTAAQRRRAAPLFAHHEAQSNAGSNAAQAVIGAPTISSRRARLGAFVERIPFVGKRVLGCYQRTRQVLAPGLHWKQRIRLIPFVGAFGAWAYALSRLESESLKAEAERVRLRQFEDSVRNVLSQMSARLNQFDQIDIAARLRQLEALNIEERLSQLDALQLEPRLKRLDALQIEQRLHQLDALQLEQRLKQLDALQLKQRLKQLDDLQIEQRLNQLDGLRIEQRLYQFDGVDIAARLNRLEHFENGASSATKTLNNRLAGLSRELRGFAAGAVRTVAPAANQETPAALAAVAGDSFYIDFEDYFRGSREDITSRLAVYLPYLDRFVGDASAQAVDLGCGRGEWLELLGRQGIKATGIDLSSAMVDACHEHGLQARCMDALHYLRNQAEGSLALVTGFHIIEHLPLDVLLALLDAALRALRPDGMVIFETPNPENMIVGACNFYTDPTHLNPIVPVVADFMARQRGFAQAEILRLHPYPETHRLPEDNALAKRFNEVFYGPQDYALLAWKTHAI